MTDRNYQRTLVIIPQNKLTNDPHYEKKTFEYLMIDNSSLKMFATGAQNPGTPDYIDASNLELHKSQRKGEKEPCKMADYDCHFG